MLLNTLPLLSCPLPAPYFLSISLFTVLKRFPGAGVQTTALRCVGNIVMGDDVQTQACFNGLNTVWSLLLAFY